MTVLHLGVLDLPYADSSSYRETQVRKPKTKPKGSMTTGDVADILEERYHPMEIFFELHGDEVAAKLLDSMEGALESVHMGAPVTLDPTGDATSWIERRYKEFITNKEMDALGIPGVPTQASLEGHSKRFKRAYKRRKARPSFVDTGLYVGAFKAWIV